MDINKEILNEIERFEQCGTRLDVESFVSNLKEILGRATPKGSDLRFEQEDDAVWVFSGDSQQGTEISHLITSHIDDYNEDDVRLIYHYAANEIDRLRAKLAKAPPEGFVLVPKVITDEWMAVYVDPEVSKYCKEFEGLPFAVTEKDLPMIQEDFRRPIKAAHSRLMKVIEAQEQSHD